MTDLGAFLGARLGAHAALHAGTRLVRPLIVVVSCAMALRLMAAPGGRRMENGVKRLTPPKGRAYKPPIQAGPQPGPFRF